jgi:hypothetical protein
MSCEFDGMMFSCVEARAHYIGLDKLGRQKWRDEHGVPTKPPVPTDTVIKVAPHIASPPTQPEEPGPMEMPAVPAPGVDENAEPVAGAVDLLHFLAPQGPWTVRTISSLEGGSPQLPRKLGYHVACDNADDHENGLYGWIGAAHAGKHNCYLHVAVGPDGKPKLSKESVIGSRAVWTDIDPGDEKNPVISEADFAERRAKILAAMQAEDPPFSCIVDSGNGYQAYKFIEPYSIDGKPDRLAALEAANKALNESVNQRLEGTRLRADKCHSADHLMRLPGTTNFLTAKKRSHGYPEGDRPARIVLWRPERVYKLEELRAVNDEKKRDTATQRAGKDDDGAGSITPDQLKELLSGLEPKSFRYGTRWRLLLWACHHGTGGAVREVFVEWSAGDDQFVAERAKTGKTWDRANDERVHGVTVATLFHELKLAGREDLLSKARDKDLAMMNERHCVIEDIGGKCVVLNETIDPVTSEARVTFSSFEAIANRYGNKKKKIGESTEGKPLTIPLSQWWYSHPKRRQMAHVAFAPGRNVPNTYNLWPGYSVVADHVDSTKKCALYLAHIRDNICRGDEDLYQYVIRWMANAVQRPDRPGGAALVLRGKMGIGKGEFVRHLGSLFGRCFIPVTKAEHITGRFNGHMGECVLLFADECFFPGNPQHEQILKVLVTERRWLIERKGIDAVLSDSCLHIILACNNDWSVPVGQDDRRYCCIEAGNEHIRDRAYFADIDEQMNRGGREALLGFLLDVDLEGFNPESFPRTAEHDRQRANTRHGVAALVEACQEGRLPCSCQDHADVAITSGAKDGRGFDHYIATLAPMELRRMTPGKVKNALKEQWACAHWRETDGQRRAGIKFPALPELRSKFEERFGPQEWRAGAVDKWEACVDRHETRSDDRIPF